MLGSFTQATVLPGLASRESPRSREDSAPPSCWSGRLVPKVLLKDYHCFKITLASPIQWT